ADAAVVHFEQLFFARHHKLVIDADFAELVLDHRQLATVLFGQDAIEQRCFTGPKESGEYRDGNGCRRSGHGDSQPNETADGASASIAEVGKPGGLAHAGSPTFGSLAPIDFGKRKGPAGAGPREDD